MNEEKRNKLLSKTVLKTSHHLKYLVFVFLFKREKKNMNYKNASSPVK